MSLVHRGDDSIDVGLINQRIKAYGLVHFVWFEHGDGLGATFACSLRVFWVYPDALKDRATEEPLTCLWCLCGLSR